MDIETARLRLEPIKLSHLEGFHRIWSNPLATRWTYVGQFLHVQIVQILIHAPGTSSRGVLNTVEETSAWLSGILPENRPGSDNYGIFVRPSPHSNSNDPAEVNEMMIIGVVGVHRVDPVPELGYILHPATWGRGYATEAVTAFVRHFWQAWPGLDVIEAKVDEKNPESIRVLRKCGFVEGETIRGGAEVAWLDPPRRDLVVYRLRRAC